ncbi:MAG: 3-hydroxy-9,10-secoandrosta-1,3,5(10)-triene-9,17-dione monooxygenase [Gammaproteobacteria bacterium]|jgi:3-hydroxy-9,10-secoandrosta-1,3,5(10)-triene-9,17-dione monooxygenase
MTVTKEELLERVNGLLPAIAARAEQSEQDRKPHPDSIKELIDIEVMQTLVPKCFGGHELGIDTLTAVARAVSSACMSTGWVTAFYLGHNWMLTKFSEKVQREVFADRPFGLIPIQPSPGVTIKKVTGGYEISGRSNFSSGIMNADWVVIAKSGGEDGRAFVVPIEDVEVDDVWHMSGMSATGSNDVITRDLFVPEYRTLPARDLFEATPSIHENPLYTMPLLPFIYCEVMGVYCGGLEGATAAYEGLMQEKITTWGNEVLANKQAVHIYLGDAHSQTRAAGILLERLVSDTQDLIAEGSYPLDARLDLKLRAGHIGNLCREAMNAMMAKAGTRSFRKDFPLQRFFRDLNTLTSHAFIDWDNSRELFGRHRLGLEPNHPLF